MDTVRIYVQVPQAFTANFIGAEGDLRDAAISRPTLRRELVTTSNAVNIASHSMLVELQADNSAKKFSPVPIARYNSRSRHPNMVLVPATRQSMNPPGCTMARRRPDGHGRGKHISGHRSSRTAPCWIARGSGIVLANRLTGGELLGGIVGCSFNHMLCEQCYCIRRPLTSFPSKCWRILASRRRLQPDELGREGLRHLHVDPDRYESETSNSS